MEKIKHTFKFNNIFPKIVLFWDNMEKYVWYGQTGHKWRYGIGACALHFR